MFFCKQWCTYVDARPRATAEKFVKTAKNLTIASTGQQRQAENILDERTLNREQIGIAFTLFQGKCREFLSSKETATTTELRGLFED